MENDYDFELKWLRRDNEGEPEAEVAGKELEGSDEPALVYPVKTRRVRARPKGGRSPDRSPTPGRKRLGGRGADKKGGGLHEQVENQAESEQAEILRLAQTVHTWRRGT